MEALVHRAEFAVGDVGINLGRGDIGVTEQELHGPQIGAIAQEISGKTMAESVGSHRFHNARGNRVTFDNPFDASRCQARFPLTNK